eukprot:6197344-Pleurochrysis_carterae.AAC.1
MVQVLLLRLVSKDSLRLVGVAELVAFDRIATTCVVVTKIVLRKKNGLSPESAFRQKGNTATRAVQSHLAPSLVEVMSKL